MEISGSADKKQGIIGMLQQSLIYFKPRDEVIDINPLAKQDTLL